LIALGVKKAFIDENLIHNSRSNMIFICQTHKGFASLTSNISDRNFLKGKIDYENLEISLDIFCLNEGVVQPQNEEGMIPLIGGLWIAKDGSASEINLTAEINRINWVKLKSDVLTVSPQNLSFKVSNLNFEKIAEDEDCFVSEVKLSLIKYSIEKS
jgi:hypothetical protein